MATVTTYPHIALRDDGVPVIAGTQFKIVHIVLDKIAWGLDADEIQRQHPHLSLSQIHMALAYYYDHNEEMDREIEEGHRLAQEMRASQEETPGRAKLRAQGLIP